MSKRWIQMLAIGCMIMYGTSAQAYYNPQAGRFIQRDPLGYVDGMNLYQYARGNPLINGDPLGGFSTELSQSSDTTSTSLRTYRYYGKANEHIIQKVEMTIGFSCDGIVTCTYKGVFYEGWILSQNGGTANEPGTAEDNHYANPGGALRRRCAMCCDQEQCKNGTFTYKQQFSIIEGGKIDIQNEMPPLGKHKSRYTYLAKYNNANAPLATVTTSDGKIVDFSNEVKTDMGVDISKGFTASGGRETVGITHNSTGVITKDNDGKCGCKIKQYPASGVYK